MNAVRAWVVARREDLLTALFTMAVCVLIGAPAGLIWSALAPHARVVIDADGARIANGVSEVFVAADGWFLGVALVAGLVTGFLTWLVARGSGPFVVAALAIGGSLGGLVAAEVGMRPGQDALQQVAQAGRAGEYLANVALQAQPAVLIWPVAAMAVFLTLVLSRVDEIG